MKNLEIEKTANTPLVSFNAKEGVFKVEGRAIPENPGEFFDNLIMWSREYLEKPFEHTQLNLNFEYVNSGSSKYLLGLLRVYKDYFDKGVSIEINWYYEEDDESILSLGEHYKNSLKLPFNLIEYI